jgi:hypothetical protein
MMTSILTSAQTSVMLRVKSKRYFFNLQDVLDNFKMTLLGGRLKACFLGLEIYSL